MERVRATERERRLRNSVDLDLSNPGSPRGSNAFLARDACGPDSRASSFFRDSARLDSPSGDGGAASPTGPKLLSTNSLESRNRFPRTTAHPAYPSSRSESSTFKQPFASSADSVSSPRDASAPSSSVCSNTHLSCFAEPKALEFASVLKNYPQHITSDVKRYLEWMKDISFPDFDEEVEKQYTNKSAMLFHKDVRNAGAIYSSLHLDATKRLFHGIQILFSVEIHSILNDAKDLEGYMDRVKKYGVFCEALHTIHEWHYTDLKRIHLLAKDRIGALQMEMEKMKQEAPSKDKKIKRRQSAVRVFGAMVSLFVGIVTLGVASSVASSIVQPACSMIARRFNENYHRDMVYKASDKIKEEKKEIQDFKKNPLLVFEDLNSQIRRFAREFESFYENLVVLTSSTPGSNDALKMHITTLYKERKTISNTLEECIAKMLKIQMELEESGYDLKTYSYNIWLKKLAGDKFERMTKILTHNFS